MEGGMYQSFVMNSDSCRYLEDSREPKPLSELIFGGEKREEETTFVEPTPECDDMLAFLEDRGVNVDSFRHQTVTNAVSKIQDLIPLHCYPQSTTCGSYRGAARSATQEFEAKYQSYDPENPEDHSPEAIVLESPVSNDLVPNAGKKRLRNPCEECGEDFYCRYQLLKHYGSAHRIADGFRCRYCGRYFTLLCSWGQHEVEHQKELRKRVSCIVCRRELTSDCIRLHIRRVHGGNLVKDPETASRRCFQCGLCDFRSWQEFDCRLHLIFTHRIPDGEAEVDRAVLHCYVCAKDFKTKRDYNLHCRRHEDPFFKTKECPTCRRRIKNRYYEKHRLTHEVGRGGCKIPRVCEICQKPFYSKYAFEKHVAVEHGLGEVKQSKTEKVPCPECGVVFYDSKNMVYHLFKVHGIQTTELKSIWCVECGKVYHSRTALHAHKKAHEKKRKKRIVISKVGVQ